ncbi:hypothetical protein M3Y95_00674100 [Aphelenchoides besseyi]|nr:hypothetical protein M3Y95_00674100 [Aphelenchoides besseyi]
MELSKKSKTILLTVGVVVLVGATAIWTWSIVSQGRRGVVPTVNPNNNLATARSPAKKRRRRRRSHKNSKLSAVGNSTTSTASATTSNSSLNSSTSNTSSYLTSTATPMSTNRSFASTYKLSDSSGNESDVRTAVETQSKTAVTRPPVLKSVNAANQPIHEI